MPRVVPSYKKGAKRETNYMEKLILLSCLFLSETAFLKPFNTVH